MKKTNLITAIVLTVGAIFQCGFLVGRTFGSDNIPLPEHPRPDFQRADWVNLNGPWQLRFDPQDIGVKERWSIAAIDFPYTIMVPFPWGSKLSNVPDEGDIGWYKRSVAIPDSWKSKRVYLVVGASDWTTTAWLDGKRLGDFQGGYTPFEFEMTDFITPGKEQNLAIRVDDTAHPFKLEGKQGYGPARGIWQTIYLEARPANFIDIIHFLPDIDNSQVTVKAWFDKPVEESTQLNIRFKSGPFAGSTIPQNIAKGTKQAKFDIALPNARLWSLEDPFLYEVDASLQTVSGPDTVSTYFGMRKISVVNLPGTELPCVALNNKPVYMQLTLDQAYHPDGFYTYPSDAFMRDEILRTRRLGLNGQRIHVKIDLPRKLYWADRLGILIMADVPNSWGSPTAEMKRESETALKAMIRRDFNHPAIFSWILFNETWGLKTHESDDKYLPETQQWVEALYKETKLLDPTRLVEDNSPCNNDHVATDMNTWHAYLPGCQWKEYLDRIVAETHPGSKANYIGDRRQNSETMFNSECGNVWGYKGSTGDVDWSWDYHKMINEFRRHPKIAGFLYTEHHDVVNEWNGYYRYDRSSKFTGMDDLVAGMTIKDLHAPFYISTGQEISRQAKPGETLEVPLFASFMTDSNLGPQLQLRTELYGYNDLGEYRLYNTSSVAVPCKPWMHQQLDPLEVAMPDETAVAVLALILQDNAGAILSRNFTTFIVADAAISDRTVTRNGKNVRTIRFAPDSFTGAQWSLKQWNVLDGLKVNGAGTGFFEYTLDWPADLDLTDVEEAAIRLELSAKQLFGKDIEGAAKQEGDFMRGKGTHDPSRNPNSYPMTDEETFPSAVRIRVAGDAIGVFDLPDDPADHRGILSWHSQLRDGQLREAGSYGYLVTASIPAETLKKAASDKKITVRLEVGSSLPGGLAIYGRLFGRYPLDPTLTFVTK